MALTVGDRAVHRLTAEQVLRMAEVGLLPEQRRLELLDGVLTEKPVKGPKHALVKTRLGRWLADGLPRGCYDVRYEDPLVVPDAAYLPEPDVAVVPRQDRVVHPTTALLVVEVALSSLEIDVGRKAELYADAGAPEYWVVDVAARRLVRFTSPQHGRYARREVLISPATLRPVAFDPGLLDLAELLAGL